MLGMGGEEVAQRRKQLACVLAVASMQSRPNILNDHLVNFFGPAALLEQVFGKRRGRNLGHVLVLRDGEHLSLGQSAKGNAIFERYHGFTGAGYLPESRGRSNV